MQTIIQQLNKIKLDKKKYPLVYFEWNDSSSQAQWLWGEDATDWAKNSNVYVKHVGWLIDIKEDYVLIAGRLQNDNKDKFEMSCFGNLQKIPNTWIKDFKILK